MDAELNAFAARIQDLIEEFARREGISVRTIAGALVGAGVELSLRNGLTEQELRAHFALVVQIIAKQLKGGEFDA